METNGKRKAQRTRVQHYVPQLYLGGFANAEAMVCYDKVNARAYPISIRKAAQESNFYEIPSTPQHVIPDNLVEDALARLEGVWAPLLTALICAADAGKITCEQLLEFSPFLAIQWIRTKSYREATFESAMKQGQVLVDDLVRVNFPGMKGKLRFSIKKSGMAAIQAQHIFDPKVVEKMAESLDQHIWVVGINNTEHPFYTSDHPVVRRGNRMIGNRLGVGFNDPGIEFAFPLDSRHILLIMERTHFTEWKQYDNRVLVLTPEQICDYNRLQVRRSNRWLYCVKDNFDLAREICTAEPAICNPDRPRVTVGSTPMVRDGNEMRNYTYMIALE